MRSKASIDGHPIHPMLIVFPFGFLMGGFFFDLVGRVAQHPSLWSVGFYLTIAGVATALLAAIPGFIDYIFTVPPQSSGKARATKHMLIQLTMVALFLVAWLLRDSAATAPGTVTLGLEGIGSLLLGIGGWLGGTLAYRNAIGVDHRYAEAGVWKEASYSEITDGPIVVGRSDELKVNQMKLLHVGKQRIVLGRTEDGYVAFDDSCTHRGGSLAGGVMLCGTVHCPWHGSQFDTHTGKATAGPAKKAIKTYQVDKNGNEVRLTLNRQSSRSRTAKD